jgi:hypothetical protein
MSGIRPFRVLGGPGMAQAALNLPEDGVTTRSGPGARRPAGDDGRAHRHGSATALPQAVAESPRGRPLRNRSVSICFPLG